MKKTVLLVVLGGILLSMTPLFGQDLSVLNQEVDTAEVKWTYSWWRPLLLDLVPEPTVHLNDEEYKGFVLLVSARKNIYGGSTKSYANLLLPPELGRDALPTLGEQFGNLEDRQKMFSRLYNVYGRYKETEIGSQLGEFSGDSGWYNWEKVPRHMGSNQITFLTFTFDVLFKIIGSAALIAAPTAYYATDGEEMDENTMSTMIGTGIGLIATANLIDLFASWRLSREYGELAERLGE